ncbi:MAG: cyclase family protein [Acidobacteria bacterium]|nr:cyclase family protein [Acidobacteriota bacterium]
MKKFRLCLLALAISGIWLGAEFVSAKSAADLAIRTLSTKDVEEMMTTLSNWGRWGKDDQIGTLNLITPRKRKQAASEVKEGMSISLARELSEMQTGGSTPFKHKMTATGQNTAGISAADAYSFEYHGFLLTHLDALCHLFHKGRMYNNFTQQEVTETGAKKLSVINMKGGLFTRGILMDMPRHWGTRYLEGTRAIYPEDLDAWEKKAGIKIESGDAILIRTGSWARRMVETEEAVEQKFAGLHASCLPWLKKRDVAIIGSDLATDILPSGIEGFMLPVHWVAIIAMGTPILDNCDLEALSEAANTRKRWSFLLTAAPLAVRGGTGSPINPVATF